MTTWQHTVTILWCVFISKRLKCDSTRITSAGAIVQQNTANALARHCNAVCVYVRRYFSFTTTCSHPYAPRLSFPISWQNLTAVISSLITLMEQSKTQNSPIPSLPIMPLYAKKRRSSSAQWRGGETLNLSISLSRLLAPPAQRQGHFPKDTFHESVSLNTNQETLGDREWKINCYYFKNCVICWKAFKCAWMFLLEKFTDWTENPLPRI